MGSRVGRLNRKSSVNIAISGQETQYYSKGTRDLIVRVKGVCIKESDSARLKFYPYVMGLSAFFLLATVFVYSCFPKVMDSNSARLRRHLAVCMLVAFTTQMVRYFKGVTTVNNVACRVAGEYSSQIEGEYLVA